MATARDRGAPLLTGTLLASLALGLLAGFAVPPAGAAVVDVILAELDGSVIAASDIALARALGLFGFVPSEAPIGVEDLDRFVVARLIVGEAGRLGIQGTAEEVERAWEAVGARVGGLGALTGWLEATGVEPGWARRLVEEDLRRERFVALRFRAFAFVTEAEVAAALGPGPQDEEARERMRERLQGAAVERGLAAWLEEARSRANLRRLLAPGAAVPNPIPMPTRGGAGSG
jgi:hypothetical protein